MEVRYALREELERVNELRRAVSALHAAGRPDIFPAGDTGALEAHVYEQFDSGSAGIIVACSGGVIRGFAMVEYVVRPPSAYTRELRFYHVKELGVDAGYRRQGTARALTEFMKEDARRRGFHRLELDMWEFNRDALRFYEAAGFTTYRRHLELLLTEEEP